MTRKAAAAPRPSFNDNESPLAWLRRRKDKDGQPMISAAEFEAGSTSTCDRVPPDIGRVRSAARTPHTVAVTGALTHAVLLFAA